MCRRWFGLLGVFLGLVSLLGGEGIQLNMTAPEVEMAVGRPTSQLARGERAIWNYPDGGQVILEGGLVVSFKNLPEAAVEESLLEAEAPVATEIAKEEGTVESVEASAAEAEDAANNAAAMEDFFRRGGRTRNAPSGGTEGNAGGNDAAGVEVWLGVDPGRSVVFDDPLRDRFEDRL